jgi:hypothetical protein
MGETNENGLSKDLCKQLRQNLSSIALEKEVPVVQALGRLWIWIDNSHTRTHPLGSTDIASCRIYLRAGSNNKHQGNWASPHPCIHLSQHILVQSLPEPHDTGTQQPVFALRAVRQVLFNVDLGYWVCGIQQRQCMATADRSAVYRGGWFQCWAERVFGVVLLNIAALVEAFDVE